MELPVVWANYISIALFLALGVAFGVFPSLLSYQQNTKIRAGAIYAYGPLA